MRKRLLRSRSGFEKPESREEAIMQNILGASNVLEPSESNIEEILKSILYNTPYTKEAEFEIEKILLAIKNNGTYDGEGESRDMKILIAILKDLDYTEEAQSRIEELFIEWLHQRSSIKVLEGVPPLTFTANGQPLLDYLISGNTVQSGTPTPDIPVDVAGCGAKTENLFDIDNAIKNYYLNNGVPTQYNAGRYVLSDYIPIASDTATISAKVTISSYFGAHWAVYDENKTFIRGGIAFDAHGSGIKVRDVDTSGAAFIRVDYSVQYLTDCMLNLGSTPLPYEPYGYKIPISSANTTTPVYLGEVESTRKIKKLVLTGKETSWSSVAGNAPYRIMLPDIVSTSDRSSVLFLSTHYLAVSNNESWSQYNTCVSWPFSGDTTNVKCLQFRDTNQATLADFKTYLQQQYAAGTPVTVWYVLATEETAVVNEPIRKIGDYADTVSMEQAGVQIPTNNGTTVIDVDTTLKPSNVYIKYK